MCFYRPGLGDHLFRPAEKGNAAAQFALGRLYFEGRAAESHNRYFGKDGKDLVASYTPAEPRHHGAAAEWLQKAADQGHTEAQQLLEVLKLHIKDGVH